LPLPQKMQGRSGATAKSARRFQPILTAFGHFQIRFKFLTS